MKKNTISLLCLITFVILSSGLPKAVRMLTSEEISWNPIYFTPVPRTIAGTQQAKLDLNGIWQFNPAPPPDFHQRDNYKEDGWQDITVPGEWVMQGFKVAPNTSAVYFRKFKVAADWKNQRIILRCDAVYSKTDVFINGQWAGHHEGGFTPFEFDVTALVQPDQENRISLSVQNESLADTLASGTQYAAHQMGGITRKIYLFAVSPLHLSALNLETTFDDQFENAFLRIKSRITNHSKTKVRDSEIVFQLTDLAGKKVEIKERFKLPSMAVGEIIEKQVEIRVASPAKWDAEHPNLYTLEAALFVGSQPIETIEQRFGFRQVEVRGNQLFVNNRPVKLRGINRHEVHPVLGRSLNRNLWQKDAELFREANLNYIRTSHYPPAEEFIEMCDSLGLFVELEAPFVWIGHSANATWDRQNAQETRLFSLISQGLTETIAHYFNHPSILFWSMANESAWGKNWKKAFRLSNLADPTRPKTFHDQAYGGYNNLGSTMMPIANMHYPGPDGPEQVANFTRPLLFGEYCHLNTYNRQEIVTDPGVRDYYGEALAPMWDKIWQTQACLGGAIWSGIDDVFELPDARAVGYGEWGPIDGWRRKKPEFWHIKKVYSPLRILNEVEAPPPGQPIIVEIENRNDFTNLKEIEIEWGIGEERGNIRADIEPHTKGILQVPVKQSDLKGKNLELKFTSPRGFLIDVFRLPIGGKIIDFGIAEKSVIKDKLKFEQNQGVISVSGRDFTWQLDAKTGQIIKVIFKGKTVLVGGPHLMLLSLISGPCSTEHSRHIDPYNAVCSNWVATNVQANQNQAGITLNVEGEYDEAKGGYTLNIGRDGSFDIAYQFSSKIEINPRQIGIVFDLPRSFDRLSWKRQGQWTVYPDDHIGRSEGTARPFPAEKTEPINFRLKPEHGWAEDYHPMGCNDFRSTRRNIYWATLSSVDGFGVKVHSAGKHHVRTYLENDQCHLLIAGFNTGGADIFLDSHYRNGRKKLKEGDCIQDTVKLKLIIE